MYVVWSKGFQTKRQTKEDLGRGCGKDCQAYKLNKQDATDHNRRRKLIKDVWWSRWVWVSECFFWYWPTRVVPDKEPLNDCVWHCVFSTAKQCLCSSVDRHVLLDSSCCSKWHLNAWHRNRKNKTERTFMTTNKHNSYIIQCIRLDAVIVRCAQKPRTSAAALGSRPSRSETICNCPCHGDRSRTHLSAQQHEHTQNSLIAWKGSPYSIAERRVPELIPVLGSQLQVTWIINPTAGCHYFPPGLQLPPQPLRGLLPILLLGEQRHNGCEQFA